MHITTCVREIDVKQPIYSDTMDIDNVCDSCQNITLISCVSNRTSYIVKQPLTEHHEADFSPIANSSFQCPF